jgi:hypothetical protein
MNALHDAFRRDLDDLLATRAARKAVRARWTVFREQLCSATLTVSVQGLIGVVGGE